MSVPFSLDDVSEMKRFFDEHIEETLLAMFQRCPTVSRLSPAVQRDVANTFAGFAKDEEAFTQDNLFNTQMMSIIDVSEVDEKKYDNDERFRQLLNFFGRVSSESFPKAMMVMWIDELERLNFSNNFREIILEKNIPNGVRLRNLRDFCHTHNLTSNRKLINLMSLIGIRGCYFEEEEEDEEEED